MAICSSPDFLNICGFFFDKVTSRLVFCAKPSTESPLTCWEDLGSKSVPFFCQCLHYLCFHTCVWSPWMILWPCLPTFYRYEYQMMRLERGKDCRGILNLQVSFMPWVRGTEMIYSRFSVSLLERGRSRKDLFLSIMPQHSVNGQPQKTSN